MTAALATRIGAAEIMRIVREYYGLKPGELAGPARTRNVSRPRQMAYFLVRKNTNLSLSQICARFGRRDHTTIIHGLGRVEHRRGTIPEVARDLERLQERINSLRGGYVPRAVVRGPSFVSRRGRKS